MVYENSLFKCSMGERNWAYNVKTTFNTFVFSEYWDFQNNINEKQFIPVSKNRILDCFKQSWMSDTENNSVLNHLYFNLKPTFGLGNYIQVVKVENLGTSSKRTQALYPDYKNVPRLPTLVPRYHPLMFFFSFFWGAYGYGGGGGGYLGTCQWDLPMLTGGFLCGERSHIAPLCTFFCGSLSGIISAKFSWTLFLVLKVIFLWTCDNLKRLTFLGHC